jgi:hypothetical protein
LYERAHFGTILQDRLHSASDSLTGFNELADALQNGANDGKKAKKAKSKK